jgi:hypothetical protein
MSISPVEFFGLRGALFSFCIDLQRFAKRALSRLAGPRQKAKLRKLGRRPPWNLTRIRATQLLRELQPANLVDYILVPFRQRDKFRRNEYEVRKRVDRFVTRARERGVPAGVIAYEGRRYTDAVTASPRTLERNLLMEEAIERTGLSAGKYYMRGLRNSP